MMRVWIVFWVAVFLLLDTLDWMWETASRMMDSKAFAGFVFAADAAILLRILGVW